MKLTKHPGPSVALVALLAVVAAPSTPVYAQEAPADAAVTAEVDRERLMRFARAHIAIREARDEFHGEVARVHDEAGRRQAREAVDERIAEILADNETTREEYDQLILLISLDGDVRATFDEIVAQLQEEPSEPS